MRGSPISPACPLTYTLIPPRACGCSKGLHLPPTSPPPAHPPGLFKLTPKPALHVKLVLWLQPANNSIWWERWAEAGGGVMNMM